MMKKILFLVMVSVMMLQVFALVENSSPLSIQTAELKSQVEGKELIGLSAKLFGNEKVNVYVTADDGSQFIVGVETKDKKVVLVTESGVEKPTLRVYTSEKVIREIMAAHEPLTALQQALQEEKITYNAVGIFNKIKFSFISLFAKFGTKGLVNEKVEGKKEDKPVVKVEGQKNEKVTVAVPAASGAVGVDGKTISVSEKAAEKITANVVKNQEKQEEKVDATSEEKKPAMTKIAPAKEIDVIAENDEKNEVVHSVAIRKNGFDPLTVTVKVGETVEWKNERDAKVTLNKGMIVGALQCSRIKSKILAAGEMFRWKADKVGTCTIVEGISAVQTGTLVVEK